MAKPLIIIRDLKGRFASRRKRKVKVWTEEGRKAGPRFSREILKKWRDKEIGSTSSPEPTLRERVKEWSGIKGRARKREIPVAVKFVQQFKQISQVRFKGDETLGKMLARSKMLRQVSAMRPGQTLRIRIKGKTRDKESVERGNVFDLRGNARKRMNLLLFHTIAVLGKELIEDRGRGYRILTKNDKITFFLDVVTE